MRFIDTNVVLYSVSTSEQEREKRAVARGVLESHDLCVSTQVLGEFFYQAARPTRADAITPGAAGARVDTLRRFPVQPVTAQIVVAAIAACTRYQISYWDAAIIEAARAIGADTVLSEDMSDGQDYGGVRVVNPFR